MIQAPPTVHLGDVARIVREHSALLNRIILFEGRTATNDPDDPGGLTIFGITYRTWDAADGIVGDDDPATFLAMTEQEARMFYAANFILPLTFITHVPLLAAVVDYAIHSGPITANAALQQAIGGIDVDGVIGHETRTAVRATSTADADAARIQVCCIRLMDMGRQIARNPKKHKYAEGWNRRVAHVLMEPVPGRGAA